MNRLLDKMQEGIEDAAEALREIKNKKPCSSITYIYIDQDHLKMTFSIEGPDEAPFFEFIVGEEMAEALVLMEMMDESMQSTGLRQAANNWAEDLSFSRLGNYSVSDSWSLLEGFEGYDDEDEDYDDDEDSHSIDIDPSDVGLHVMIAHKQKLGLLILNYDKQNNKLMINLPGVEMKAFEYASPEELCKAIAKFESDCQNNGYAWESAAMPIDMDYAIQMNNLAIEKPSNLMAYLTQKRGPSDAEKLMNSQKTISCVKRVFFKNIQTTALLICDEVGLRILNPVSFDTDYYWTFKTPEELQQAFDKMKDQYLAKGYAFTLEEKTDYPFDYMLAQIKSYR